MRTDYCQRVASDLLWRYPITAFMNDKQVDYSTSLVRDGVNVNIVFAGFDELGEEIFSALCASNAFMRERDGSLEDMSVNYFIFDLKASQREEQLKDGCLRYCAGFEKMRKVQEMYLPLPTPVTSATFFDIDTEEDEFFEQVRRIVTASEKNADFVYISTGDTEKNIRIAERLLKKRAEWGREALVIFVNCGKNAAKSRKADRFFAFGDSRRLKKSSYGVFSDEILSMALLRNEAYAMEYAFSERGSLSTDEARRIKAESARRFFDADNAFARESSAFGCLSIRFKLNLLGLDCVKRKKRGICEEEYLSVYARGDMPEYDGTVIDGRRVVRYSYSFLPSLRKNMAVHEHARWNAFMISRGFVPSSKEQIRNEIRGDGTYTNGKNFEERRHGNITTFEGLFEFAKIIAERNGRSESDADVVKLDYQLLDNAHWLLNSVGYRIVYKK